ncbi:hypothetical protein ACFP3I_10625 [Chryseobacterium arachidis]
MHNFFINLPLRSQFALYPTGVKPVAFLMAPAASFINFLSIFVG